MKKRKKERAGIQVSRQNERKIKKEKTEEKDRKLSKVYRYRAIEDNSKRSQKQKIDYKQTFTILYSGILTVNIRRLCYIYTIRLVSRSRHNKNNKVVSTK